MLKKIGGLRKSTLVVIGLLLIAVIAVPVVALSQNGATVESAPAQPVTKPLKPQVVQQENKEQTEDLETEEVINPAVNDNVAISELRQMKYSPVWNPPDMGEAFWQIVDPEYGYPEEDGTKYIVAHACEARNCAGDMLLGLNSGDQFSFFDNTYTVVEKFEAAKDEIALQPIWGPHDANKIVFVTCIIDENWWDSDHNEIIVATLSGN